MKSIIAIVVVLAMSYASGCVYQLLKGNDVLFTNVIHYGMLGFKFNSISWIQDGLYHLFQSTVDFIHVLMNRA